MPSLLDPSLFSRSIAPGDDPTGIQTLLSGVGSAISGGVAQPNDPQTSMASLLAAAGALANAGAPTLGPPPTTAQAILGALGAGRNAAISTGILPYMQERAQQQLEQQNLDYQIKLFDYQRRLNYANMIKGGVSAVADTTGGAPAQPGGGGAAPPPASIASLDDVQRLPDATRIPFIQVANQVGMNPAEAAQYARMIQQESAGLHIDKDGNVITNPKSGATGVAQVMPDTFTDMAKAHGIQGAITDLIPNLTAGANYFHDQVLANNGNLRNGAIAYSMGPTGLADYLAGHRTLPAETQDYLVKTRAPGIQVADASGRVPVGGGQPVLSGGPGGPTDDPLVRDPISGAMVPRSIEQAAIGAGGTAADGPAAHSAVIKDYLEKKALMPTYRPGAVPGTQVTSQGQSEAAPVGAPYQDAPTADERARMFPNVPKWQDIVVTRDQSGRITGHTLPEMGPEKEIPISDADAQKPVEQGGAGESYRPGTAYARGDRTGLVKPIQIERGAAIPPAAPGAPQTPGQLQAAQQVFQQTQELENQVVHSPLYTQWALGAQRYDAVLAGLNQHNRVGDQAAIESLAKVFDPSAVVNEGKLQMAANYGGVQQQLQNLLGKITGETGLPDAVRQQIVDLATAEMKTRDAGVIGQIQRSRASAATRPGLLPENVMPLFQTTALTAADPEARNAPKGVQLAPPVTLQNGQYVRGEAPPAATTTQQKASQLPVPSPHEFAQMSVAGVNGIIGDMRAHPERYSDAYRSAFAAAMKARPASGGGG